MADPAALDGAQLARYRGCYCGLCRALYRRHRSHLTLTYDMTFLVLLLTSLYEPEEAHRDLRCAAHPLKAHECWRSEWTDYGADMNLALAYHKCMDDWRDERSLPQLLLARRMKKRYARVREDYPRQCQAMEECMARLSEIERRGGSADEAANCFGALMAALFSPRDDLWAGILSRLGAALGRFIYMMDAVLDLPGDEKRGRYNPVLLAPADSALRQTPEAALSMLLAEAKTEFEKLPLVQDHALLRGILDTGVWQKYAAARQKGKVPE